MRSFKLRDVKQFTLAHSADKKHCTERRQFPGAPLVFKTGKSLWPGFCNHLLTALPALSSAHFSSTSYLTLIAQEADQVSVPLGKYWETSWRRKPDYQGSRGAKQHPRASFLQRIPIEYVHACAALSLSLTHTDIEGQPPRMQRGLLRAMRPTEQQVQLPPGHLAISLAESWQHSGTDWGAEEERPSHRCRLTAGLWGKQPWKRGSAQRAAGLLGLRWEVCGGWKELRLEVELVLVSDYLGQPFTGRGSR